MSVQILSDGEVVFEFEDESELQALITIILHAKFSNGMRREITLSKTAYNLVHALSAHLHSKHKGDKLLSKIYKGSGPHKLNDGGELANLVMEQVETLNIEKDSDDWHKMMQLGLYPWLWEQ